MPMTYTISFTPTNASTFMVFDAAAQVLTISPYNSSFVGTYLLRYTGAITESLSYSNFTEFSIEITKN